MSTSKTKRKNPVADEWPASSVFPKFPHKETSQPPDMFSLQGTLEGLRLLGITLEMAARRIHVSPETLQGWCDGSINPIPWAPAEILNLIFCHLDDPMFMRGEMHALMEALPACFQKMKPSRVQSTKKIGVARRGKRKS